MSCIHPRRWHSTPASLQFNKMTKVFNCINLFLIKTCNVDYILKYGCFLLFVCVMAIKQPVLLIKPSIWFAIYWRLLHCLIVTILHKLSWRHFRVKSSSVPNQRLRHLPDNEWITWSFSHGYIVLLKPLPWHSQKVSTR